MQVLVTGATGFVGRFAVRELVASGHHVRALVRDPVRARDLLGPDVQLTSGSAMDSAAVRVALDGCDALVQSAGVYSYDRRDAQRVLVETPALAGSVLTAALDADVPLVVDLSSTIIFTTKTDAVTASTRLVAPGDHSWADPYARAKVAAEQIGRTLEARGLRRVTLHPSRVLGPEDVGPGPSGAGVVQLLRGGTTTDARGGWVDVRDLATAVANALRATPGTRAIVNASSATYRRLAPTLDGLTGLRPRRTFLPPLAVRTMARLNDVTGGRLLDLPRAGALEYLLTSPPVDGSSATAALGLAYRPFEATLTDSIRWWATNGVIPKKLAGRLGE